MRRFIRGRGAITPGLLLIALVCTLSARAQTDDPLRAIGCLDVTRPPYDADPTGERDSTQAIQRAVNDARDSHMVCFFPEGTYRISAQISCEQQVERLDQPRQTDAKTQHYWDKSHRIVMIGSTKGKRPVLKLAPDAAGFDDPANPRIAVWIWAQTRDDAPGKQEPEWGKEQPNISFSHIFKGIDIDVSGHAGAIGLRHAGSQGSAILDCTVRATGAYAGLSNCCGQGGGTHNVTVEGGRYGILIDRVSRFPLLNACNFLGQTEASIRFVMPNQVPSVLVGCRLEPAAASAVQFDGGAPGAGINLVDCRIALAGGGPLCRSAGPQNIHIEDSLIKGATTICTGGASIPDPQSWTQIALYSMGTAQTMNLVNGVPTRGEVARFEVATASPTAFESIQSRHYSRTPSFEDADAVSVTDFGAKGDGTTDDTSAFQKAIDASDKVFVPRGRYRVEGRLQLGADTQLFGMSSTFTSIGGSGVMRGTRAVNQADRFVLATVDDAVAAPVVSFLAVNGQLDWRAGKGTCMMARAPLRLSGNGGGRFYGTMGMGGPFVLRGLRQPTSFYALNVERVTSNPQSLIEDCDHVRIYFFKVEAGTLNRAGAPDGNTPSRIADSRDVRVYALYGVVRKLGGKPMLDLQDCEDLRVSQVASLSPDAPPTVVEQVNSARVEIPAGRPCAIVLREEEAGR